MPSKNLALNEYTRHRASLLNATQSPLLDPAPLPDPEDVDPSAYAPAPPVAQQPAPVAPRAPPSPYGQDLGDDALKAAQEEQRSGSNLGAAMRGVALMNRGFGGSARGDDLAGPYERMADMDTQGIMRRRAALDQARERQAAEAKAQREQAASQPDSPESRAGRAFFRSTSVGKSLAETMGEEAFSRVPASQLPGVKDLLKDEVTYRALLRKYDGTKGNATSPESQAAQQQWLATATAMGVPELADKMKDSITSWSADDVNKHGFQLIAQAMGERGRQGSRDESERHHIVQENKHPPVGPDGTPTMPQKLQETAFGKLADAISTVRGRGNLNRENQQLLNSAGRLEALIRAPGGDIQNLTPQQVREAGTSLARLLSSGSMSLAQIEELTPSTMASKFAAFKQKWLNEPQGADAQAFLENMLDTTAREKKVISEQIRKGQLQGIPAHANLRKADRARFDAVLKAAGIDPATVDDNGLEIPPPSSPANGETVKMISPEGKTGNVPAANLNAALKRGFRRVE